MKSLLQIMYMNFNLEDMQYINLQEQRNIQYYMLRLKLRCYIMQLLLDIKHMN